MSGPFTITPTLLLPQPVEELLHVAFPIGHFCSFIVYHHAAKHYQLAKNKNDYMLRCPVGPPSFVHRIGRILLKISNTLNKVEEGNDCQSHKQNINRIVPDDDAAYQSLSSSLFSLPLPPLPSVFSPSLPIQLCTFAGRPPGSSFSWPCCNY